MAKIATRFGIVMDPMYGATASGRANGRISLSVQTARPPSVIPTPSIIVKVISIPKSKLTIRRET